MHKYLRAIGFSKLVKREDLTRLTEDIINSNYTSLSTAYAGQTIYADYRKEVAKGIGLTLCGEWDETCGEFKYDYCYPYIEGEEISSEEKSVLDRHSDKISFAGVCDDSRIGISIIYYLNDRMDILKNFDFNESKEVSKSLTLSALSVDGTIVMPIMKGKADIDSSKQASKKRSKLMEAAKNGDEDAIETLTLDDMDLYNAISKKVKKQDVYTLVDSSFMPYGIECDQYSVLGEIKEMQLVENALTKESIYKLTINCNGIPILVGINKKDLFGEPEVGRRFKGTIWLQGKLD